MREFTEYFDGVRQLASYLRLMGVDAPDIFGLGVEDVARLSAADVGRTR
jgi:hypothetical protein